MCYIDNVVVFHCAQAYWVLSNDGQITRMVLQAKRGGPGLSTNEYLVVLAKFVYFCLIISFFKDEWHSYYRCLLNYGLQYLQMDSVAKEGDVGRFIIMLKRNLELFLGYHHRSLYAAEIVDTLTKLRSMDNMSAARAISGN